MAQPAFDWSRPVPHFDSGAEEWRPIPGTNGRYEASSFGRIRSLWFKSRSVNRLRAEPLVLKPAPTTNGYLCVRFANCGPTLTVHRLVLLAFSGAPPAGKPCAGHIDGTRTNNAAANLEWVSYSENNGRDRRRHGTALAGEKNHRAKLSADAVRALRAQYAAGGYTFKQLAAHYGVSVPVAHKVVQRKAWAHVA